MSYLIYMVRILQIIDYVAKWMQLLYYNTIENKGAVSQKYFAEFIITVNIQHIFSLPWWIRGGVHFILSLNMD